MLNSEGLNTISSIFTIIISLGSLTGGIVKFVLPKVFTKSLDRKVLMTSQEQTQSSILSVFVAFLSIVFLGFIISFFLFDVFYINKEMASYIVIAMILILAVALLVLVTCNRLYTWVVKTEKRIFAVSVFLIVVFFISLTVFPNVSTDIVNFIILDTYLSMFVLLPMWKIFNNPQKEDSFYIYLDSGNDTKERWYIYRRISDREILCGRSRIECGIKEYKIVQLADVDLIKKELDETIEQGESEQNGSEGFLTEINLVIKQGQFK